MNRIAEYLNIRLFALGDTDVTPLSLIIFGVTIAVAMLLGRGARALVMRLLGARPGVSEGVAYAIGRILQYAVLVTGVLVGLENVGVSITALAAFGAVLSVGIGFGLQNIAQNFISGLILLVERPVQRGDFVQLADGVFGSVMDIEMRATRVLTLDGVSVLVPNSKLISEDVYNLSAPTKKNRVRVAVGVAYGSDTRKVEAILRRVADEHPRVMDKPSPEVFFTDFGDSSLDFELAVWVRDAAHRPMVGSDLRFAIDDAFRAEGVQIPFPQRDVHFKNGLEGRLTVDRE